MKKYYQERNTTEKKEINFELVKESFHTLLNQIKSCKIQYNVGKNVIYLNKIINYTYSSEEYVDYYEENYYFEPDDKDNWCKIDIKNYMLLNGINISQYDTTKLYEIEDENLFFSVVEFIHDNIYDNTTTKKLDFKSIRQIYRNYINNVLCDYKNGYELNENGEIIVLFNSELKELVEKELPESTSKIDIEKIESAIKQFKNRNSTIEDKRMAIAQLSAVLERIRGTVLKENNLSNDESDLFNIANNFGIRHTKNNQKTDYDIDFLYWMFQSYLATIHLALRLKERKTNLSEVNN